MEKYRIRSLKSNNKLLQDYDIRVELAAENPNMMLEDLAKITEDAIKANRKVSSTLKLNGTLRISWAFDMKYNKQIGEKILLPISIFLVYRISHRQPINLSKVTIQSL